MEVSYHARAQKIYGAGVPKNGKFSSVLEGIGDTEDAISQRGKLFSVIEISGPSECDLNLVMSLAKDSLFESYFGNLEGTPLSALEKAVLETKEKVLNLTDESWQGKRTDISLGAIVLWGNVVYLAQIGDSQTLLLRNSEVIPLGGEASGEVNLHSSVLEDGDVFISATGEFLRKFTVDFVLKNSSRIEEEVAGSINNESLCACIVSINSKAGFSTGDLVKIALPRPIKKASMLGRSRLVLLSLLSFFAFGGFAYKFVYPKFMVQKGSSNNVETTIPISQIDTEPEIEKLKPLFSFPSSFAKSTGAVFVNGSEEFKLVNFAEESVLVVDNQGKKIQESTLSGISSNLPESVISASRYLDNYYLLSPSQNQIFKVSLSGNSYKSTAWVKDNNANLSKAVSLAVNYFVYVLEEDGTVSKYLSGEKLQFALSANVANAKAIFPNFETDSIYIYSPGLVYEFSKEGELLSKIELKTPLSDKETVVGLSVIKDTKEEIYLITKSAIYMADY